MVVFGGRGCTLGADGAPAATAGWNLRKTTSEIAPRPQTAAPSLNTHPTCGIIVKNLTISTPTHIRPTSGHNSHVLPNSHCPISAPTTTSPKCSAPYHKASVQSPTKRPTTVTQVMHEIGRAHV